MAKRERISKHAADMSVAALEEKLAELLGQLKTIDTELQALGVAAIQKKIADKKVLEIQISEIQSGIKNIRWAQNNPENIGSGCTG